MKIGVKDVPNLPMRAIVMSLLKHVSDLDRMESIQKASVAGYVAAIDCMAQYPVEVDPSITEQHQQSLRALLAQVSSAQGPESLLETQPLLQAELRDYRDKCGMRLTGLRQEFTSALVSLQEVMSTFSSSGKDQERDLKQELTALETLAAGDDPDLLRRGVHSAVKAITECVEQMRRGNDIVVAQFRDEIRTMQLRMEAAEATAALDRGTGALTRSAFESRVRRVVLRDGPVCLLIVKVGNLRDLRSRHGKHLSEEALAALFRRVREDFGEKAEIGRWSDEAFMVTLLSTKQDSLKRTKDLAQRLAAPYICLEEGRRYTLHLKIHVGIADVHASDDSDRFLARAESLRESMA